MAWLRGQTTWSQLVTKLTQLAAGEVADDTGLTVPPADRWIRETVGVDLLCSHVSQVIDSSACPNRQGYWATINDPIDDNTRYTQLVQKTLAIGPGGGVNRWVVIYTTPFNQTTAGVYNVFASQGTVSAYNADTGVLIASATVSPSLADGTINTFTTYMGSAQLTNPVTGKYGNNIRFIRYYDSTHLGGVDIWPVLARMQAGAAVTTPTAPSGVAGTDYDIMTAFTSSASALIPVWAGHGLGIKTLTGLSGSLYTVQANMALARLRLLAGNGTLGSIGSLVAEVGAWRSGPDGGSVWRYGGHRINSWMSIFDTPASVLSSSLVQYWMCVKVDKIIIICNGDPGQTGRLGIAGLYKFTPYYPGIDKYCMVVGKVVINNVSSSSAGANPQAKLDVTLDAQRRINRNNDLGTRDWQLGWMRMDVHLNMGSSPNATSYHPLTDNMAADLLAEGISTSAVQTTLFPSTEPKPNPFDDAWHLYGVVWCDQLAFNNVIAVNGIYLPRGETNDDWFFLPSGNWSTGDELIDVDTGKVYFLLQPEFTALGMQVATGSGSTKAGGIAVLEEA